VSRGRGGEGNGEGTGNREKGKVEGEDNVLIYIPVGTLHIKTLLRQQRNQTNRRNLHPLAIMANCSLDLHLPHRLPSHKSVLKTRPGNKTFQFKPRGEHKLHQHIPRLLQGRRSRMVKDCKICGRYEGCRCQGRRKDFGDFEESGRSWGRGDERG
jgi:hypothetical protein